MDWPAFAYLYGTWGYALERAREKSKEYKLKTYLYQGKLNGKLFWVVSFDPKEKVNG